MDSNITDEIIDFLEILNRDWIHLNSNLQRIVSRDEHEKEDIKLDWYQFNWEIFVESRICESGEFLVEYGEGAECNFDSDRVRYPSQKATHEVVCKSKSSKCIDLLTQIEVEIDNAQFYKFVSFDGSNYSESTPFDFALIEKESIGYFLVECKDVDWFKKPLE